MVCDCLNCMCMGIWACEWWVCGCVCVCGCVGVLVCECVGVWLCGCVGMWVCGCVGVWVCALCACVDVGVGV